MIILFIYSKWVKIIFIRVIISIFILVICVQVTLVLSVLWPHKECAIIDGFDFHVLEHFVIGICKIVVKINFESFIWNNPKIANTLNFRVYIYEVLYIFDGKENVLLLILLFFSLGLNSTILIFKVFIGVVIAGFVMLESINQLNSSTYLQQLLVYVKVFPNFHTDKLQEGTSGSHINMMVLLVNPYGVTVLDERRCGGYYVGT